MNARTLVPAVLLLAVAARPAHAQRADWAKAAGDHHEQPRTVKTDKGETIPAVEGWIAVPERRDTTSRLIEIHYLRPHLVIPNAGHEQILFQNDTTPAVVVDFLAGQDVRERHVDYPPLRFLPLVGTDSQVRHPSVTR